MNRDEILKMQAGREMDALVAEKVMGWFWLYDELCDTFFWSTTDPGKLDIVEMEEFRLTNDLHVIWQPSTNIADAWKVVEKIRDIYSKACDDCGDNMDCCELKGYVCPYEKMLDDFEGYFIYYQISIFGITPLTICRAALIAVMEK